MKKLLCMLLVMLIMLLSAGGVYSAGGKVEIVVTDEGELTTKIVTDFEYCAASFELEYNKSALQFQNSTFSDLLSGAMAFINPDYSPNTLKISIICLEPIAAGEICEIKLLKKDYYGGDVDLNIINATFADETEEVIEFESVGARIEFPQEYIGGTTVPSPSGSVVRPSQSGKPLNDKTDTQFENTSDISPSENVSDTADNAENTVIKNPFEDVTVENWYYNAVCYVYEAGITKGVTDTLFAPQSKVTRGQFITMLCRAYGIDEMTGDNFDDGGNTWYTGYLAAAKQLGISNGVGNNMFAPEKEISREEMVTLIYNYLKSADGVDGDYTLIGYADSDSVSEWAMEAVAYASSAGIVKGKDGNVFDPGGNATRAELAQVFYNMLNK